MSLIRIASLASGTVYTSVPFVGPQNPSGAKFLTPATGQQVHVYLHGTTTPAAVFLDEAGQFAAVQPLTTGTDGTVPGFIDPSTLPLDIVVNGATYELAGGGAPTVTSVFGRTGAIAAASGDYDVAQVTGAAPLASPALTGTPTAPTQAAADNSTKLATTAFAQGLVVVSSPPVAHQVVTPSGADDTPNAAAAVANAYQAGLTNNSQAAQVLIDASHGPLTINGALDTTKYGRAQIPLPIPNATVAGTQKFVLGIFGPHRMGAPLPHWNQTAVQKSGACLVSNLNAAFSGVSGAASVIGGPTAEGIATAAVNLGVNAPFVNLLVIIDGLVIVTPYLGSGVAVDLQHVAQVDIGTLALSASIAPGTLVPDLGSINASGSVGIRFPLVGNNDYARAGRISVEGYNDGVILGEHAAIQDLAAVYCGHGVSLMPTNDAIHIDHLSTEACNYHLFADNGSPTTVNIDLWEIEDGGLGPVNHIYDPNNQLYGTIHYRRFTGGPLNINGGANVRLYDIARPSGPAGPPAVPAASTAFRNPYDRDAMVKVSGGTGVTFTVDGQARSLNEWAPVRTCGSLNLGAYTVAPTWSWYLL